MRTSASIAQVKARLSDYLRRVKRGDDVIITERGVPIATRPLQRSRVCKIALIAFA